MKRLYGLLTLSCLSLWIVGCGGADTATAPSTTPDASDAAVSGDEGYGGEMTDEGATDDGAADEGATTDEGAAEPATTEDGASEAPAGDQ